MDWPTLDFPTRAGFVAAVMAVVGVFFPLFATAAAIVAIVFAGFGWKRSRKRGEANPVARYCLLVSTALIVVLVAGTAIYSAAS